MLFAETASLGRTAPSSLSLGLFVSGSPRASGKSPGTVSGGLVPDVQASSEWPVLFASTPSPGMVVLPTSGKSRVGSLGLTYV